MDVAELRELLSSDGLRLLDSLPDYDSTADVVRSVADLRKAGHSAGMVAAVLSQARLRARAVDKFGLFASQMLFTEIGLQQATRLRVAAIHAGRYREAGLRHVADLGCGIGGDALALAALDIEVTAVEQDEVTAAVAAYNLAAWSNVEVVNADVRNFDLAGHDSVYLDPSRRSGGKRLKDPADWSPPLDFAFGLADTFPTGVKVGPGMDRDLLPAGAEAQWVSIDHDVVELGIWFGPLGRDGIGRSALVLNDNGSAELTAATDSVDAEVGELGEYVFEPDGAVIRSRLIGDLVRNLGARMLDHRIAYFTADAARQSPFASCFKVLEKFPYDERQLTRELASRNIGTLEIKKRGVDIDPASLRKRLHLTGEISRTLIVTRVGDDRVALLCERVYSP
jgi:THUMP domain-like